MKLPFGLNIIEVLLLLVTVMFLLGHLTNSFFNKPRLDYPSAMTMKISDVPSSWMPGGPWDTGYEGDEQCKSSCDFGFNAPSSNTQPWCFTNVNNKCIQDPKWGFCTKDSIGYNTAQKYIPSGTCNN